MKPLTMTAMAALLCAGTAAPAMAAWDHIGTAHVGRRHTHDRVYNKVDGQIRRVELRAEGDTVRCKSVRATFHNGHTRQIYSGRLRQGQRISVDLPGNERRLERIDFACRAPGPGVARISVAANVERRGLRHSRYDHLWQHGHRMMHKGAWVMYGRERFDGRRDHETAYGGWRGNAVNMIALKPNGDARCNRVRATFDNGHTRKLNIGGHEHMQGGRMYTIDLPGHERNIKRIDLNCHAAHGRHHVKIDIYAHKGV